MRCGAYPASARRRPGVGFPPASVDVGRQLAAREITLAAGRMDAGIPMRATETARFLIIARSGEWRRSLHLSSEMVI
jgi:hypothetical protein